MYRNIVKLGMVVILLALAGCQSGEPGARYQTGALVLEDDFSLDFGWDRLAYDTIQIGIGDGVYEMRSNRSQFVRGFNAQSHSDVVIEVETRQLSTYENNAYGVICRATPGDHASGYYFLIGGDGTYSIRKGRDQEVVALTRWIGSNAVQRGIGRNQIRAVCVGDYLALYVNGQFVTETHDRSYQSGYTGFTVAVGQQQTIDVTFDNLTIHEASLIGR